MAIGQPHGSRLLGVAIGGKARGVVTSEVKYRGVSQESKEEQLLSHECAWPGPLTVALVSELLFKPSGTSQQTHEHCRLRASSGPAP